MNGIYANSVQWGYVYGGTFTGPVWRAYMNRATEGMDYVDLPQADLGATPPPPAPPTQPAQNQDNN